MDVGVGLGITVVNLDVGVDVGIDVGIYFGSDVDVLAWMLAY